MDRKELINNYKERKITGGVYKIINTKTNMYLLSSAVNLEGANNRFNFAKATGTCIEFKLQKDWDKYSSEIFIFEIVESINKKTEQDDKGFAEDVKVLEEMWREKFGSEKEY